MLPAFFKYNYRRGEVPSLFKWLAPALFIYIFLFPVSWQSLFAVDVKEPAKPLVPGVETPSLKSFETVESQKGKTLEALLYVYGMDTQRGRVLFPFESFTVEIDGVNPPGRSIKIADLRDISILQWKGKPDKKDALIFYPEKYVLNLRSGESIEVGGNIPFFNILRLERNSRVEVFYSYFYDYSRRVPVVNSGDASTVPEVTAPVKGCITGIRLFP